MKDVKVLSPARAAGMLHKFTDRKVCWSKALVKFRVWDKVSFACDLRHVGEVTAVYGKDVTVRWENGWRGIYREDTLVKAAP